MRTTTVKKLCPDPDPTWDYVEEYDDPKTAKPVKKTKTYWEAWLVKGGKAESTTVPASGYTDYATEPGHSRAKGTITVTGEIKFFLVKHPPGNLGDPGAKPIVPPDPSTGWLAGNGTDWSGILPYIDPPGPAWWSDSPDNGEKPATRGVTTKWECTCSKFSMAMSETISVSP